MTWEEVGIKIPTGAHGNIKTLCPKCSHSRKNKRDRCLSVNIDEKIWHCFNCGWSGRLIEKKNKVYVKPPQIKINLSPKTQGYLEKRGISVQTIQRFKIASEVKNWAENGQRKEWLIFPYFRNGELVNAKYRDAQKSFRMVKDAELILFNLDGIDGQEEITITEGEFDTLAMYESKVFQVCSVPNGASRGSAKLEYLDNCYEAFRNAKRIILATDGDEPGTELRNELARRLGKHRCFYVEYPEGCKDANEVLLKFGPDKVKEINDNAKPFPVEGIFRLSDIEKETDELFYNGLSGGERIGYEEFDKHFSFRKGDLTVVTGIPGSGKSAFIDQCLVRLSSRHRWKHGICSFENQPTTLHIGKLAACFTGKSFFRKDPSYRMSDTEWAYAKYFIDEHFYFFAIQDIDNTVDGIITKAEELVTRYGIDSLLIDPWNYLEFNLGKLTETQFVSKALSKIIMFAKAYNVHVLLVAHPTKIKKEASGKFEVPTLYSINGSSHFFNKTDNGMVVYRDFQTNEIRVYIQKIRWFFVGKTGSADFQYEVVSGRYAEVNGTFENEMQIYYEKIGLWKKVNPELNSPKGSDDLPF